MEQNKPILTQGEVDELLKEKAELEKLISELSDDVKDARSQGDLSENADYQFSRQDKAAAYNRKKEIDLILKNAEIVEANDSNNIDKYIKVRFLDDGFEDEYHLLGGAAADPLDNEIGSESPLGKALFKAKEHQVVTVITEDNDRFDVEVLSIRVKNNKKDNKKNEK